MGILVDKGIGKLNNLGKLNKICRQPVLLMSSKGGMSSIAHME
jgi:hypothetical protein